jgi:hypothetical protein
MITDGKEFVYVLHFRKACHGGELYRSWPVTGLQKVEYSLFKFLSPQYDCL